MMRRAEREWASAPRHRRGRRGSTAPRTRIPAPVDPDVEVALRRAAARRGRTGGRGGRRPRRRDGGRGVADPPRGAGPRAGGLAASRRRPRGGQRRPGSYDALVGLIGKPRRLSSAFEVYRGVALLRQCDEEISRLHGENLVLDGVPGGDGRWGLTRREPYGVVAAITPRVGQQEVLDAGTRAGGGCGGRNGGCWTPCCRRRRSCRGVRRCRGEDHHQLALAGHQARAAEEDVALGRDRVGGAVALGGIVGP